MSDGKRQVPSVGRVVHYVAYGTPGGEYQAGAHRAAIITEVPPYIAPPDAEQRVSLCVFNPTGLHFHPDTPYDPTGATPGTWHWPEYVPSV